MGFDGRYKSLSFDHCSIAPRGTWPLRGKLLACTTTHQLKSHALLERLFGDSAIIVTQGAMHSKVSPVFGRHHYHRAISKLPDSAIHLVVVDRPACTYVKLVSASMTNLKCMPIHKDLQHTYTQMTHCRQCPSGRRLGRSAWISLRQYEHFERMVVNMTCYMSALFVLPRPVTRDVVDSKNSTMLRASGRARLEMGSRKS